MTAQRQRLYRVATVGRILEVGERAIFARLRAMGFLTLENTPTSWALSQGYAISETRQFRYPVSAGGSQTYAVALVTEDGLAWLRGQVNGRVVA